MRLLLLLLLFLPLAVVADVIILSEVYGSLESPNFPEPYPTATERRWNISVPEGFRIRLDFSHFDLEPSYLCEYDYVKVEAEGEVVALLCGKEQTDTEEVPGQKVFVSPRNSLSVVFSSDFSNQERFTGFRAHYSATDVDECVLADEELLCDHVCHNYIGGFYCSCRYGYQLHPDNRSCTVECSGDVFREPSGGFSSVDFPSPYPKKSECSYLVQVEVGFTLTFQFDDKFDVEDHPDTRCPYDYVEITTGGRVFGPFCGSKSPGVVQTDSNEARVRFHSDDSGENLGWRLTYTTTGSRCPQPEAPPHTVLNPVQSEYFFKDHLVYTCESGYRLLQGVSHYQIECGVNGSWSGEPPQCHMVDCGIPSSVDQAEVLFVDSDNQTTFGARIQLVCREDDASTNNRSYSCGPNGEWTDSEGRAGPPACPAACGRPSRPLPSVVKRIVGGRSSEPGLFPWQVLLSVEDQSRVPEGRWFGSGALLSESWVLTAAHVLRTQRRDPSVVPVAPQHVKVFLGLHDVRDKRLAVNRSVDLILLHPSFQPDNYDNDIALLRLTQRVTFSPEVRPVCLPTAHKQGDPPAPPPSSLGVVAGWGISTSNSSSSISSSSSSALWEAAEAWDGGLTSDLLQYVKLPVVEADECAASYASRSVRYNITANMFCAGFLEGGRDTCLGDSGGAFVMQDGVSRRWAVLGLVSWGGPEECGSRRVYGVYTRISKYVDWIQKHINTAL